jgi:hypothetical protein
MPGESSESLPPEEEIHRISLIDHARNLEVQDDQSSDNGSSTVPTPTRLSKRVSAVPSLRNQKNRWKYARYSLERAEGNRRDNASRAGQADGGEASMVSSTWGMNPLDRSRQILHKKFRPQRLIKSSNDQDSEIDVLYENQRGLFMFGIPFFSSNALGPWDAPSWADHEYKKSRVNITNAQVPDPSWLWAWKNWYVDMGGDVDEEGWEYSFLFKGCSWHGTHPWFHSFVRRRRWIRKRCRSRPTTAPDKVFGTAHMMNQDYFTIHSGAVRPLTSEAQSPSSENPAGRSVLSGGPQLENEEKDSWDDREIPDLGTLIRGLREVPVDSERIALIRRFLEQGGEDLYYLADEVCHYHFDNGIRTNRTQMQKILSYFFYESSCRRLLGLLTDSINAAKARREEHTKRNESEDENESRKIESLLKAAKSVDEQCKKLEYWSDVRDLTKDGRAVAASKETLGLGLEWQDSDTNDPSDDNSPTAGTEEENKDEEPEFDLDEEFEKGLFSLQPEQNDDEDETNITASVPSGDGTQELEQSDAQDQGVSQSLEVPDEHEGELSEDEDLKVIEPVPENSQDTGTS